MTMFRIPMVLVLAAALSVQAAPPATAVAALREVAAGYAAEGTVEAVRQAVVAAQVPGRVIEMRVDAGQRVRQGEVLARIDSREAAAAAAAAQAQFKQAQAQYERTRELHGRHFVSQAALDQAEADFRAVRAQTEATGAGLSHGTLTSPLAGVVGLRHAELGDMAQPGRPLLTVFDPRSLRVVASIPQQRLAEVRRATAARVEFPESGRWIEGVRFEMLPMVDPQTHAATARVLLPEGSEGGEGIVPGLFARVHFLTGKAPRLTVPAAAVIRRGEVIGLYVADDKGVLRLRQVRLGEMLANGELEVLAGLRPGERYATDGARATLDRAPSPQSKR
ncbi:efflux RND transporter periplasmic adaptor subunit [Denitratisoma sp. DHT3]|uniref:efflux RND transporter periplasmic adaptor subunit n=1 Tax=Denitratisoma sp. DHT3 TaxID=1981880 RepID=UPI001648DDDE|nr:efflux RND transporter periplasmic adaptor subunit [Denitratisoma sp. DHT3]